MSLLTNNDVTQIIYKVMLDDARIKTSGLRDIAIWSVAAYAAEALVAKAELRAREGSRPERVGSIHDQIAQLMSGDDVEYWQSMNNDDRVYWLDRAALVLEVVSPSPTA